METYQAFDKMLKVLNIRAQEVCECSGVSKSRLSQFRSGKGSDIGVRSLDAMLNAAQEINPQAKRIYATYLGGVNALEEMTLAEKGELMIALAKSVRNSGDLTEPKTRQPA
jgi:DNA-binding Xre family transcriptional regulator